MLTLLEPSQGSLGGDGAPVWLLRIITSKAEDKVLAIIFHSGRVYKDLVVHQLK